MIFNSLEAEQAVLGSCLLEPELFNTVSDSLTTDHFCFDHNKQIYDAMIICDNNLDLIHVNNVLEKKGVAQKVGGMEYLMQIMESSVNFGSNDISSYVKIIKEYALKRSLRDAAQQTIQSLNNPNCDLSATIDAAQSAILDVGNTESSEYGLKSIGTTLRKTVEGIKERYEQGDEIVGLTTGFHDWDARTKGLREGKLILLAARPSMGKTTFALNVCLHAARNGKNVLVFSLEMDQDELNEKFIAASANLLSDHITTPKHMDKNHGEGWAKLTAGHEILKDLPMEIDCSPNITVNQLCNRAKRAAKRLGKIDLIMIDYIGILNIGMDRVAGMTDASRKLKILSKELKCPVLALAQLNRSLEKRDNKEPIMSDLRDSGSLEQDADIISFMYRDEIYNEHTDEKDLARLITRKQRGGSIGTDMLQCRLPVSKFETSDFSQNKNVYEPENNL